MGFHFLSARRGQNFEMWCTTHGRRTGAGRGRREVLARVAAATAAGVAAAGIVPNSSVDWPGHRPLHRDAQHHRQRARLPQRDGSVLRDAPAAVRAGTEILTEDELRAVAQKIYPGWEVTRLGDRISRRNPTLEVWVEKDGVKKERLFNPYTGEELGDSVTQGEYFVLWLARLHDELLFDREGRFWNGIFSAVATVLFVTGIVVWWPGVSRWKRSLVMKRGVGWKRFNWDLHNAIGFWLFLFMLMWGISGFYLGVPEPFSNFVDSISDPEAFLGDRPGDIVLSWLTRLHFGRWRDLPWLKAFWAIVGLVPALMFFTGVVMWWNRVLRQRPVRQIDEPAEAEPAA